MLELQKELGLNMHSAQPDDAAAQENAEAREEGLARLQAVFPLVESEEQDNYMSVDQDLERLLDSCDCADLIPAFSVADIDTCEAAASYSPEEMQVQILQSTGSEIDVSFLRMIIANAKEKCAP
jgi:hypothetical protein